MYGVNEESDIEEDDVETEADLLEGDIAVPEVYNNSYFTFKCFLGIPLVQKFMNSSLTKGLP